MNVAKLVWNDVTALYCTVVYSTVQYSVVLALTCLEKKAAKSMTATGTAM